MTDPRLEELLAAGTAPERDAAFAERVEAGIDRARLVMRLVLAGGMVLTVALAVTIYITGHAVAALLASNAEDLPEFMGVPVPLVLAALAVGLLLRAARYLRLRPL